MQHDDVGGVRIATAAAMLEYDPSTIRRKIKDGDLEAFGSGRGLRVTRRSLRAYQNGERGKYRRERCHEAAGRPPRAACTSAGRRAAGLARAAEGQGAAVLVQGGGGVSCGRAD